jgi:PfaB family protein
MKDKPSRRAGSDGEVSDDPIAITSFGGVFPGARTLEEFWSNLERGVDVCRPAPRGRWILNPSEIQSFELEPDKVFTDRGCFIEDFHLDPAGLNLPQELLAALDPSVHLLLAAGRGAWSGSRTESLDLGRVGVVFGNIVLPTSAVSELSRRTLKSAGVSGVEPRACALNRYVAGLPAGTLAQALGLGGGSCTLDAACASSLYALKLACDELRAGRADAMLAGGMSRPDSLYTQMGFTQLHALSRTGRCAPFDLSASGLIVGEGAGVVVLKRLDDALRAGDQIHALIRGIGLSNDLDGNLLSPSSEGQLRALRQAYEQAGWTPDQVDFIECHATGTPVGDAVEFESLTRLWRECQSRPGQCGLGAVKANIGHLLTGAGAASLIKVLLALKHETWPGVANFRQAGENIRLAGSPFRIRSERESWKRRDADTPRRAAINGFGFGGINAHVLIEEWREQVPAPRKQSRPSAAPAPIAIVGMSAIVGRWPDLRAFQQRVLGGGAETPTVSRKPGFRDASEFAGYYLDDLELPVTRYRIPPKELAELLPQQALMLETARAALADANLVKTAPSRSGVFIGLGLDFRSTDFHVRWAELAEQVSPTSPPLTADRTLGALAGITASRIAKEFHLGGSSYTICSEDCSGIRALAIAARALQNGELDQAIAGAVELTGDPRALRATDQLRPYSVRGEARPLDEEADGAVPGEGAVALVLKRLEDAQRDGDRIYSIIRGIGSAGGVGFETDDDLTAACRAAVSRAWEEAGVPPESAGYVEASGSAHPERDRGEARVLAEFFDGPVESKPCFVGTATGDVGQTGAASGLVSVAKASLALYQEIVPALRGIRNPISDLAKTNRLRVPMFPQYWARDRVAGPRRAGVNCSSIDGNWMHVVLEEGSTADCERVAVERVQPLGDRSEALFTLHAVSPAELLEQIEKLRAESMSLESIESVARRWWNQESTAPGRSANSTLAVIARDSAQLQRLLQTAETRIRSGVKETSDGAGEDRDRIFYCPTSQRAMGGLAFVFPGAGNDFAEMGRELGVHWPQVFRDQDLENERLASQMFAAQFWNTTSAAPAGTDHRAVICGQVALGTQVADLAKAFGLRPEAVIGYSLGESTGLFALRAWKARDEMLRRLSESTLFSRDLTGTPELLRRAWRLPENQQVEWQAGLVDRPVAVVREALAGHQRIYVLIVNTPNECVIGGDEAEVEALVKTLGCHWFPLAGVSTVHCELLNSVEDAYRELHRFETTAPEGVRFYSGGTGTAYQPDRESAAEAIVAQARDCIDFPRVIRAAYDSGIRHFLEMGPGNSCSRMIAQILEGQPHTARSFCVSAHEPLLDLLRALGELVAQGIAVNLAPLYGAHPALPSELSNARDVQSPRVKIPMLSPFFRAAPALPQSKEFPAGPARTRLAPVRRAEIPLPAAQPAFAEATNTGISAETKLDPFEAELVNSIVASQAATLGAHEAYLSFSRGLSESYARNLESQMSLISALSAGASSTLDLAAPSPIAAPEAVEPEIPPHPPRSLDRAACLEFARGSVAKVLGVDFSRADSFPTRVRLPDEPLMLVDRILEIHGEPLSLTSGRVVTEHDIHDGAWYLDNGVIPTCIAVEAGQADLFLSGHLGIDFQTEGRAVYRLLDAKVQFHSSLPGQGEVIHYDIRIDQFFRQGDTWLFRFNFEATVGGRRFLTMTDGCAGFFSAEALASGKGIVRSSMDLKPMLGKRPADWEELVPCRVESYSTEQLEALRAGRFVECFGEAFVGLTLRRPLTLPDGRMKLVHRIPHLDPAGGRFGLGLIRGEADIHPDDWFLTCHFVDDQVMPGTLMFECCLHTLRVLLLRIGWVVESENVVLEPVPGVASQLKCRGQVLASTAKAAYEISVKEIGYGPEPYVIADALMFADGKPIVEITNMSLRYRGASKEMLHQTWAKRSPDRANLMVATKSSAKPVRYNHDRILAFAIGKPSEAFGAPYSIFDSGRRIARLPGPPYQFLDRITEAQGEPFKLIAGGSAEAEYDIPSDAWYFAANRQGRMPFAVLLEVALQPCGWLAAYAGSALTSELDLSFRNLGGTGKQFVEVGPDTGTLITRVKMTKVSSSAGMIIQWYDLEVRSQSALIYRGDTYFGFFPAAALARQEGIQNGKLYQPDAAELRRSRVLPYPSQPPFADEMLRMVDHIEAFIPDGGPQGLGFVKGTKAVRSDEWFFKAHFYQDPVVPGSLGLESFLQLLKFAAHERWGLTSGAHWEAVALQQPHEWIYRGQILPTDKLVSVEAVITAVDEASRTVTADGFLSVDGRIIYGMKNFTVRQSLSARSK